MKLSLKHLTMEEIDGMKLAFGIAEDRINETIKNRKKDCIGKYATVEKMEVNKVVNIRIKVAAAKVALIKAGFEFDEEEK